MPGFYPLDQGGYAQPIRGQFMSLPGWATRVIHRGRTYEDHLLGSPELNLISPGSLSNLRFNPLGIEAPGAEIGGEIRVSAPEPPSSRIATRDGYYGLGFVDFDLTEYVTPSFLLNGGGRVSNYNGRLPHSEGYGLNLRAEVVWWDSTIAQADSSGLWGWWGVMQNSRDAEVPYKTVSHNFDRYETDFEFHYQTLTFNGYGIQHRESWGGVDDGWDEFGLGVSKSFNPGDLNITLGLKGALARWKLNNISWRTASFGSGELKTVWQMSENSNAEAVAGIAYADDFDLKNHIGILISTSLTKWTSLFAGAALHQRWPSRFETHANFPLRGHYLPYDPAFYQYPDEGIKGTSDLDNETIVSALAGGGLKTDLLEAELALTAYKIENPISWMAVDEQLVPHNASNEDFTGALSWFRYRPWETVEIGGSGSYLPLGSGERRLFPELMAHAWVQYKLLLFAENLDLRFRLWENFWGQRWFPIPGGWEKVEDDFILSGRINARLYGFQIYWGLNNIFGRDYELLPGFRAMHKEEVWGLAWTFVH
jgi:hypothetical protein